MSQSQRPYHHLGQPDGLTSRAASQWRRANTYYIGRTEHIIGSVQDNPPVCFTQHEWDDYLDAVAHEGWRRLDSPNFVQNERPDERDSRQDRAARTVACEDCTIGYQLDMRIRGRCHPPPFASTPVSRLLASEQEVEEPDGRVARPPVVLLQEEVLQHRKDGETGRPDRPREAR